jgi:hypothetical protein
MKHNKGEGDDMEKETHIYLADKIHEKLAVSFPGMITQDVFQQANIRPDRTRQSVVHPHFSAWSFDYIEKQAFFLLEEYLDPDDRLQSGFVIRLGLITHYLCDFFCQVHVDNTLFRVREHIEYETSLNRAVMEQRGHFDKICQPVIVIADNAAGWLRQLYRRCMHHYRQQPAGFDRDMKAAAWISVQAAGNILSHCLQNARQAQPEAAVFNADERLS